MAGQAQTNNVGLSQQLIQPRITHKKTAKGNHPTRDYAKEKHKEKAFQARLGQAPQN